MDHSYIDEHQVAERYLTGKLPPEDAAVFEEHSLSCPECLDRLETTEKLRLGLRRVAAEHAVVRLGLLARLIRSRQAPWIVALLLLVAVLPSGLLLRRIGHLDRELARTREALARRSTTPQPPAAPDRTAEVAALAARLADQQRQAAAERGRLTAELERGRQPLINLPVVPLSPVRSGPGAEPAARVVLSPGTAWVVFSLELEAADFPRYRTTLTGPNGRLLWQSAGLRPDATGSLTVAFHASQLSPGDFSIQVEGLPAPGRPVPLAAFPFRVVR